MANAAAQTSPPTAALGLGLEAHGLTRTVQGRRILSEVSLRVEPGASWIQRWLCRTGAPRQRPRPSAR